MNKKQFAKKNYSIFICPTFSCILDKVKTLWNDIGSIRTDDDKQWDSIICTTAKK